MPVQLSSLRHDQKPDPQHVKELSGDQIVNSHVS